jgi:hypothetical protein
VVVGLVAIVYAVIEAPAAGWVGAQTLLGVGGGLVVLRLLRVRVHRAADLQIVRGESPILASASMLPLSAGLILTSRRAPVRSQRA